MAGAGCSVAPGVLTRMVSDPKVNREVRAPCFASVSAARARCVETYGRPRVRIPPSSGGLERAVHSGELLQPLGSCVAVDAGVWGDAAFLPARL